MLSLQNTNALTFMEQLEPESVHLIVTDPPYIISKDSGMDKQYNLVHDVGDGYTKTEAEWTEYKEKQGIQGDEKKPLSKRPKLNRDDWKKRGIKDEDMETVDYIGDKDSSKEDRDAIKSLKTKLYTNIATCHFQSKNWA